MNLRISLDDRLELQCYSCEIVNNYYKPPPGDICRVYHPHLAGETGELPSSGWSVSSPLIARRETSQVSPAPSQ